MSPNIKDNDKYIKDLIVKELNLTYLNLPIDAIDTKNNLYQIKSCQDKITDFSASRHERHGRFEFKPSDFILSNLIFIFIVKFKTYYLICLMPNHIFAEKFGMPHLVTYMHVLNYAKDSVKKIELKQEK
jgi:hypothetical protein